MADGSAGLSQHRAGGAGGAPAAGDRAGRAGWREPGRGGPGGWGAAADGEPLAEAVSRAGRSGPPGRASGLRAQGPGGADRRAGAPGPPLDRRSDAGPAEAAVRPVDVTCGARVDRAALRQAPGPVDRAALPEALGHDPAKAAGPSQAALAGGDRRLAGARLSGDRQARQGRAGRGATRPVSRIRTRSAAAGRRGAGRRWSAGAPSGSARA